MTEQAGEKPAAAAAAGAKPPDDLYAQARALRAQAAALEAAVPADAPFVRLKTEAPHESIAFGGVSVGTEWTLVPAHLAAGVLQAAAEAGVTVTQQEG